MTPRPSTVARARSRRGFTLLELTVAVVVLTIVTGLLVPTFAALSSNIVASRDRDALYSLGTSALALAKGEGQALPSQADFQKAVAGFPASSPVPGVGTAANPHGTISASNRYALGASTAPGTVSVDTVDIANGAVSAVGIAMDVTEGGCAMAVVTAGGVTTFGWSSSLAAACNGYQAWLGGPSQTVPTSPALPGAPTITAVTVGVSMSATISWTPPTTNGGSEITSYTASNNSLTSPRTCTASYTAPATPPARSCTITGLTNGTTYSFSVAASSSAGTGPNSAAVLGIVQQPAAGTPTLVSVTAPTTSGGTLTWNAVPTATSYYLYANGTFIGTQPVGTTYTDTSRTPGTYVAYAVVANNSGGSSVPSNAIGIVTTPTTPTGTMSGNTASLAWTGQTAGTSWTVLASGTPLASGVTIGGSGTAVTATVIGLAWATSYNFTVQATQTATGTVSAGSGVLALATAPNAPTSLVASGVTTTTATLTWNAAPTATGYRLYQNGGQVWSGTILTASVTGLSTGSANAFTVTAYNAGGESPQSATVTTTTIPDAPTSLASSAITTSTATLTWNLSVGATAYQVFQDGTLAWSGTTTSTTLTGLAPGTGHAYAVTASDAGGTSGLSASVAVLTTPAGLTMTAVPTGNTANASNSCNLISATGCNQIGLSWTGATTGVTWTVYANGTPISTGVTIGGSGTTPTATINNAGLLTGGLAAATATTLTVAGTAGGATSAASNGLATVTAPSGLSVTSGTSQTVTLVGGPSTTTGWAVNLHAYASTSAATLAGGSWTLTSMNYGTGTTWSQSALSCAPGDYCFYYATVTAASSSASANGPYSSGYQVTPPAPTGLAASAVTATGATLSWSPTAGATGYHLYQGGVLVWTGAGTTTPITGLVANTTYSLAVTAYNSNGESAPSTPAASVTTVTTAPVLSSVTLPTTSGATLTWAAKTGASSYIVYANGTAVSGASAVVATTYTDTSETPGTYVSYTVGATNAGGTSAPSNAIALVTTPATPTGSITGTTASLAWTGQTTGTTWAVYKSGVLLASGVTIGGSGTAPTATITGITAGTAYSLTVIGTQTATSTVSAASATLVLTAIPATPTSLGASAITGSTATMNWNSSTGATNYKLYVNGVQTTSGATTSAVLNGLSANTTYAVTVTASNAGGESAPSTVVNVTTVAGAPTLVSVTLPTQSGATLTWTAVTGATSYHIFANGSSLTPVGGGVTTYTVSTQAPGTFLSFTVTVTNAGGTSAQSNAIAIVTTPSTPTAASTSATGTTLSWNGQTAGTTWAVYNSGVLLSSGVTIGGSGTSPTATITGLVPGTVYNFTVIGTNTGASVASAPSSPRVVTTIPAAPAGLAVSAVTTTGATLSWSATATATSYRLYQDGVPVYTGAALTAPVTGLVANTTYSFTVSATNASGESVPSGAVSVTTVAGATTLSAVTLPTTSGATLTWAAVSGASSYTVYANGTAVPGASAVVATTYTDTSETPGTYVSYTVAATNAGGTSAPSNAIALVTTPSTPTAASTSATGTTLSWTGQTAGTTWAVYNSGVLVASGVTIGGSGTAPTATITGLTAGTTSSFTVVGTKTSPSTVSAASGALALLTLPAAPTGLSASGYTTSGVTLTWNPSTSATSYRVYSSGVLTWTGITTSVALSGLAANSAYSFTVTAINASGESLAAGPINVTTVAGAPTITSVSPVTTSGGTVNWVAVSGATGYTIYANGTSLTSVGGGVTTYTDASRTPGTYVSYTLAVTTASGPSAQSAPVALVTTPTTPTAALTTATGTTLSWTGQTAGTTWAVYNSGVLVSSGVAIGGSGTTPTATLTGLASGTTYSFTVVGTQTATATASAASGTRSVLTIPAAPTGLAASVVTATTTTLSWTAVTGAASYKVYKNGTLVGTATSPDVITALTANTTYVWTVSAVDATGESAPSSALTVTTPTPSPTISAVTGVTATGATVTWSAVTGATSYTVYANGIAIPGATTAGLTYADTTEAPGTYVSYALTATNAGGESAPSAVSGIVTTPTAPTQGSTLTTTSMSITWTGQASGLTWTVYNNGTLLSSGVTISGTGTAPIATITGLAFGTTYNLAVVGTHASPSATSAASPAFATATLQNAPSSLTVSTPTAGGATLSWNAPPGGAPYGYEIWAYTPSGGWYQADGSGSVMTTSYVDVLENGGTYTQWRVAADNVNYLPSAFSNTSTALMTTPTTPTLSAATTTSETITWQGEAVGATWALQRNGVAYSSGVTFSTSTNGGTTGLQPTATITGLTAGTNYSWTVQGTNTSPSLASLWSAPATLATMAGAVTGVSGTAGVNTVTLNWTAVPGATQYVVQVNSYFAFYTYSTAPTYTVTGMAGGSADYFTVAAVNSVLGVNTIGPISASYGPLTPASLGTPTGLAASAVTTSSATLSWAAVTGATGYNLYQNGSLVSLGAATTTPITGLTLNTTYAFTVSAVDGAGEAAQSAALNVTTLAGAPTLTSVTAPTTTGATLTWAAVTGATGYTVYANGTSIGTASAGATTYVDSAESPGTYVGYTVAVTNAGGLSGPSNAIALVTTPSTPTAASTTATGTTVSWTGQTTGTTWAVYNSGVLVSSGVTIGGSGTAPTATITGLTAGTTYNFTVKGTQTATSTVSAASGVLSLTTVPPVPTGLAITGVTAATATPSWSAALGATSYKLYQNGTQVYAGSALTDPITGLTANTTYSFTVAAVNAAGTSAQSSAVPITTNPAAPTLSSVTLPTTSGATLTWTAVSGATSYSIWANGVSVGTQSVGTSWADTTEAPGTYVNYTIVANAPGGASVPSNAIALVTTPTTPTAASTTATGTTVSWTGQTAGTTWAVYNSGVLVSSGVTIGGSGTAPTATITGLTAGTTYNFTVKGTQTATSTVSAASGVLSLTTVPPVPTGLAASALTAAGVTLTWAASTGATGYTVFQGGTAVYSGAALTTPVTGLVANTTYSFTVSATNASGASVPSGAVSVTTLTAAPVLSSVTLPTTTGATLAWGAVTGATTYAIYANGSFVAFQPSGTTYTDTSETPGTYVSYTVAATNAGGTSAPSNAIALVTTPSTPTAASTSATGTTLSWTGQTAGTTWAVYNSGVLVASGVTIGGSGTAPTATITGLTAGTTSSFTVVGTKTSPSTVSAASGALALLTLPATPTGLSSSGYTTSGVTLTWNPSTSATSYQVFQAGTQIYSGAATTDAVTGLAANSAYSFTVTATNATGASIAAGPINVTTVAGAPTITSVSPVTTSGGTVNWPAVSGATGYTIYANGTSVQTQATNAPWADATKTPGTYVAYTLTVTTASGTSAQSAPVAIVTTPATPTGSAATTAASLSWTGQTTGTTWAVYNSGVLLSSGVAIGGSGTSPTAAITGLTPGTAYSFTVVGTQTATSTMSPASGALGLLTIPATPTGLAVSAIHSTAVTVTWTGATGAASYRLYNNGVFFATATSPDTVSGLTPNTTYVWTVSAVDATGESAQSSTATVTTPLAAPTIGTVTGVTAIGATVTWSAVTGATSYTVYANGIAIPGATTTGLTYTDTTEAPGTFVSYALTATNAGGESALSAAKGAVTTPGTPTQNLAPGATTLSITWTGQASGLTWSVYNNGTLLSSGVTFSGTGTAPIATITGLAAGTAYNLTVSATHMIPTPTSSAQSAAFATWTLDNAPVLVPATAVTAITTAGATITWSAPSGGAPTGYNIYVYADWNGWTYLDATAAGVTTYTDVNSQDGQYTQYYVTATNAAGESAASSATTGFIITPAAASLSLTAATTTSETISWFGDTVGTTWALYKSGVLYTTGVTITGTSATITGLTAGTSYTWAVKATRASPLTTSALGGSASFPTIPNAPTGVVGTSGYGVINLTWTATPGATSYTVNFYSSILATWFLSGTSTTNSLAAVGGADGSPFTWQVIANNAAGASAPSATVGPYTSSTPPAPTGLAATVPTTSGATLTWGAISGYTVGSYALTATLPSSATARICTPSVPTVTCTDTTEVAGSPVAYTVQAFDASGTYSGYSSQVNVVTTPSTPTGSTGSTTAALSWTGATAGMTWAVYNGGVLLSSGVTIGGSGTSPTATITGLAPGSVYNFTVKGTYTATSTTSAPSGALALTTTPAAPTGLGGTQQPTTESLTWTATTGASSYNVYVNGTLFGSTATNSDLVTGLTASTAYSFTVAAVNANGTSSLSSAYATSTTPAAPVLTSATGVTTTGATVTWAASTGATSYYVYANGTLVGTVSAPTVTYADSGKTAGTAYAYTVAANNAGGTSPVSTAINVVTTPSALAVTAIPAGNSAAPSCNLISTTGCNQIGLSWTGAASGMTWKVYANGTQVTTGITITGTTATINNATLLTGGVTASTGIDFSVTGTSAAPATSSGSAIVSTVSAPGPVVAANTAGTTTQVVTLANGPATATGWTVTLYKYVSTSSASLVLGTTWASVGGMTYASGTAWSLSGIGCTAGNYCFYYAKVTATAGNSNTIYADGPYTATGTFPLPATPSAPTVATPTTTGATVTIPAAVPGATTYYYYANGVQKNSSAALSWIDSGETAGTYVAYTVYAGNISGMSSASASTNLVTTPGTPGITGTTTQTVSVAGTAAGYTFAIQQCTNTVSTSCASYGSSIPTSGPTQSGGNVLFTFAGRGPTTYYWYKITATYTATSTASAQSAANTTGVVG